MIVFVGDWVKCYNRSTWHQVVDIVDSMTVLLDNNRKVPADPDVIEKLLSNDEYLIHYMREVGRKELEKSAKKF